MIGTMHKKASKLDTEYEQWFSMQTPGFLTQCLTRYVFSSWPMSQPMKSSSEMNQVAGIRMRRVM